MSFYPDLVESEIAVEGAFVRIYDSPNGENTEPTVVLVHGAGGSAQAHFSTLFPMLAFEHRVVAMDLVSPVDGSDLTLDFYVRQVEAVLEQVRDGRGVVLVGYSMGSSVAMRVAARRPDLVDSLVTVAGWAKSDRNVLLYNDLWFAVHAAESAELMADFRVFAGYSPAYLSSMSEADFLKLRQPGTPRISAQPVMRVMRAIDVLADVETIKQPTLVIACAQDRAIPPLLSKEILGAIGDSRYAEVQAGHAVVIERPAEIFALIETFVKSPRLHAAGTTIPTTTPC